MTSTPEVVADNELPGPDPEGFWDPVHAAVRAWTEADDAG